MKGDNAHFHNKGGFDFGVQVSYHANEDNMCVEIIVKSTTEKNPSEIKVNERIQGDWNIRFHLSCIYLQGTWQLKRNVFQENLDSDWMTDDVRKYWQAVFNKDA